MCGSTLPREQPITDQALTDLSTERAEHLADSIASTARSK